MPNKKDLSPIIEKSQNKEIDLNIPIPETDIFEKSFKKNDSDTYFRAVLDKLFNKDNLGSKTEYTSIMENFSGAKLEYLAKQCDMPFIETFLTAFESKRISLNRQGRKEILMALEKREEEIRLEQQRQLKSQFGIM